MPRIRCLAVAYLLITFLLFPKHLFASGFILYNQDAKSNGMANAVTSSIDNPSAVFYNPALLTEQSGSSVGINDTMVMPSRTFEDAATGTKAHLKTTTHHVPGIFARYTRDRWAFAIGVYSPFGLSSDWGQNWTGRYSATFSELKTVFVTPSVAFKVHECASVGLGVSYVDSSLELQNAIALTPFPDGRAKMKGDGDGIAFNAGAYLKLPQKYSVALTFRGPVDIKYTGTAKFYTSNDSLLKTLIPQLRNTGVSTRITLPWQATFGLAREVGALTLEADVIYIGWSSIDKYTAKFSDGRPNVTYLKDWDNAFSFALGADYKWSKSFSTRMGYMFDMSPVPQTTLSPEMPDADKHILTGGLGYMTGPFAANLAYQATFFKKASSVNNTVGAPSGRYDQFIHMLLLSVSYTL